jgi:PPOX class probable F420-dependent enzyme
MTAPADLAALDRGKYVRLTTFKRDGTAVHTPVWFAVDGTTLVVWTDAASGKVKRIRNNPAVEAAPSDGRGRPTGAVRTGTARLLDDDADQRRGHDLLNRKHGLVKKGIELGYEAARIARRQPKGADTIVEITLHP